MTVGHIVVFVVGKIHVYAVSLGRKKWRINEVTLRRPTTVQNKFLTIHKTRRHKLSQSQNTLGAYVDEEREKSKQRARLNV